MGQDVSGDSSEIFSPFHVFRVEEESVGYYVENGGPHIADKFDVLAKKDRDKFIMSGYEHVAGYDIRASELVLLNPGG